MATEKKHKFGIYQKSIDTEQEYKYGNIYKIEKTIQSERLVIGANENHIKLFFNLAQILNPPYYVLYVLVVSRLKNELGRYQSPIFETKEELWSFLNKFKEYFETDGRHHIWIGTLDNLGLLVYDQHNVIYAYGKINDYIQIVEGMGFIENEFNFSFSHTHSFHPENDKFEESLLKYFDWDLFPLADNDEYN